MDPFSFASSEALDIPLNIRMCVTRSVYICCSAILTATKREFGGRADADPVFNSYQAP